MYAGVWQKCQLPWKLEQPVRKAVDLRPINKRSAYPPQMHAPWADPCVWHRLNLSIRSPAYSGFDWKS